MWAYAGATTLVSKCNDVAFSDSIHNISWYNYNLSMICLIDSEPKTRPVAFHLTLTEKEKDHADFISFWHRSFNQRFPPVIFTDGDSSMSAAIHALDYAVPCKVLACLFHFFDQKVKAKKLSILTFTGGGASSWAGFRKGLGQIREAATPEILKHMWDDLIDEWLPSSSRTAPARQYLMKYVWEKRKKWATTYFEDAFTFGAMNTQRSEGWHPVF